MSFGGVVGFDFGTESSVVSQAKSSGIETVLNEASKRKTANVISFQGDQRFIGDSAVPLQRSNLKQTFKNTKRLIGRQWSDPVVQREVKEAPNPDFYVPFKVEKDGRTFEMVGFKVRDEVFSIEQVLAMQLNQLRKQVDSDSWPSDIVVSVPGYFNTQQRQSMVDACRIAGFEPLNLINDHTAAALSYGIYKSAKDLFDKEKKQYTMFIDVGYADTSVAIVSFVQGKLEVVATSFNENLGGRDFDTLIAEKYAADFHEKHSVEKLGADVRNTPKAMMKLLTAAEKAKQTLTPEGVNLAKSNVEFLIQEIDFRSEISLDQFETLSQPLLETLQETIKQCLARFMEGEPDEAKLKEISNIEIIGGGMRPKIVKKAVAEVLNLDITALNYGLSTTLNLDEAISRGCALNSAMLSPKFRVKEFSIHDATVFPTKIVWDQQNATDGSENGENSVVLVKVGDTFPIRRRVTFKRNADFQVRAFTEREGASHALPAGFQDPIATYTIKVKGDLIEKANKAIKEANKEARKEDALEAPQIRVDFKVDRSGLFAIESAEALIDKALVEPPKEEKAEEKPEEKGEEAKMEVDGDAKKDKDEEKPKEKAEEPVKGKEKEPEKVKKVMKKEKLRIDASYFHGLPAALLEKFKKKETELAEIDRKIFLTNKVKNELESYVYSMRDNLDMGLKSFVTEEERSKFMDSLNEVESWLYDEGFDDTKENYEKKLNGLTTVGDKYVFRQKEAEERPLLIDQLKNISAKYKSVFDKEAEKYSHIDADDRKKVAKAVDAAEAWIEKSIKKQESLPATADPYLTKALITEQISTLEAKVGVILRKPKPKPRKEPVPEETSKGEEEKKPETAEGEKSEEKQDAEAKTNGDSEPPASEVDMDVD